MQTAVSCCQTRELRRALRQAYPLCYKPQQYIGSCGLGINKQLSHGFAICSSSPGASGLHSSQPAAPAYLNPEEMFNRRPLRAGKAPGRGGSWRLVLPASMQPPSSGRVQAGDATGVHPRGFQGTATGCVGGTGSRAGPRRASSMQSSQNHKIIET